MAHCTNSIECAAIRSDRDNQHGEIERTDLAAGD
jgi:hypothetical protein